MNLTTIEKYRDFLKSQNHVCSTVAGYIRMISTLAEPPTSNNPDMLLDYVDATLEERKELLSKSNYRVLRASLSSFFFMKTGQMLKEYRKQCIPDDLYDSFLTQYADYCMEFLHLSLVVTQASLRETKLFLQAVTENPEQTDWAT